MSQGRRTFPGRWENGIIFIKGPGGTNRVNFKELLSQRVTQVPTELQGLVFRPVPAGVPAINSSIIHVLSKEIFLYPGTSNTQIELRLRVFNSIVFLDPPFPDVGCARKNEERDQGTHPKNTLYTLSPPSSRLRRLACLTPLVNSFTCLRLH